MHIDLQVHSTYSDGYLSPEELARHLSRAEVAIAALTDHHTTMGVEEFRNACNKYNIQTITGVEIYAYHERHQFNVLWYNFDPNNEQLHSLLNESNALRKNLFRKTLHQLQKHGFDFDIDALLNKYPYYVPINHIVDDILSINQNLALVQKELSKTNIEENDIIYQYLRNIKIGNLRNSRICFDRITELKKDIGGQLVLCHPLKNRKANSIERNLWEALKSKGLNGVETLSPHHSYSDIVTIQKHARELGLIETGGTDFHKKIKGKDRIEYSWDYFFIDSKFLNGIETITNKQS